MWASIPSLIISGFVFPLHVCRYVSVLGLPPGVNLCFRAVRSAVVHYFLLLFILVLAISRMRLKFPVQPVAMPPMPSLGAI